MVELEACSTGECGTPIETLRLPAGDPDTFDGLWLEDLEDSYHLFGRITGLTDLTLNWSDNVIVKAHKAAGPFDIVVNERKLLDEAPLPEIPYGSRTSVAIRNLPSGIDLNFAKGAKSLTYHGSAPIGSIEAWLSVDRVVVDTPITDPEIVNAITGRATEAHFLITDLPTDITLSTRLRRGGGRVGAAQRDADRHPEHDRLDPDRADQRREPARCRSGAGRAGDEHRRRPPLLGPRRR